MQEDGHFPEALFIRSVANLMIMRFTYSLILLGTFFFSFGAWVGWACEVLLFEMCTDGILYEDTKKNICMYIYINLKTRHLWLQTSKARVFSSAQSKNHSTQSTSYIWTLVWLGELTDITIYFELNAESHIPVLAAVFRWHLLLWSCSLNLFLEAAQSFLSFVIYLDPRAFRAMIRVSLHEFVHHSVA